MNDFFSINPSLDWARNDARSVPMRARPKRHKIRAQAPIWAAVFDLPLRSVRVKRKKNSILAAFVQNAKEVVQNVKASLYQTAYNTARIGLTASFLAVIATTAFAPQAKSWVIFEGQQDNVISKQTAQPTTPEQCIAEQEETGIRKDSPGEVLHRRIPLPRGPYKSSPLPECFAALDTNNVQNTTLVGEDSLPSDPIATSQISSTIRKNEPSKLPRRIPLPRNDVSKLASDTPAQQDNIPAPTITPKSTPEMLPVTVNGAIIAYISAPTKIISPDDKPMPQKPVHLITPANAHELKAEIDAKNNLPTVAKSDNTPLQKIVKKNPTTKRLAQKSTGKTTIAIRQLAMTYEGFLTKEQISRFDHDTRVKLAAKNVADTLTDLPSKEISEHQATETVKTFSHVMRQLSGNLKNQADNESALKLFETISKTALSGGVYGSSKMREAFTLAGRMSFQKARHLAQSKEAALRQKAESYYFDAAYYLLIGDCDNRRGRRDLAYLVKKQPNIVAAARKEIKQRNSNNFYRTRPLFLAAVR